MMVQPAATAAPAHTAAVQARPSQTPIIQTLAFKGAQLGMTLSAWRSAPFPGMASGVAPVCSSDAGAPRIGLKRTAAESSAGALVCTYAYVGPQGPVARKPVPIRAGLLARQVRYVFTAGQLSAVSYVASADAFDDIVARIDDQIGKASRIQRDQVHTPWGATLPRVRMQWRSAAGSAELTDPVGAGGRLSVTYRLAPLTPKPLAPKPLAPKPAIT